MLWRHRHKHSAASLVDCAVHSGILVILSPLLVFLCTSDPIRHFLLFLSLSLSLSLLLIFFFLSLALFGSSMWQSYGKLEVVQPSSSECRASTQEVFANVHTAQITQQLDLQDSITRPIARKIFHYEMLDARTKSS